MNIQGIVRAFRPEDLDQAAEIWLAANTNAHAFLPAEVWQEHLPDLRNALVQATVFVCEREGSLCGFIGLQGSYIAGLFVDPKLQGQGSEACFCPTAKNASTVFRSMSLPKIRVQSGFMSGMVFPQGNRNRAGSLPT